MKNNYLVQAWLVLMLAIVFGGALAGVKIALQPRIDQNKKDETLKQVPVLIGLADLPPEAVTAEETPAEPGQGATYRLLDRQGKHVLNVREVAFGVKQSQAEIEKIGYLATDPDGREVGWVIKAAGQGFADKIEILIGLDGEAGTLKGLYILDQKETPALGNKIEEAPWRAKFAGKDTEQKFVVDKDNPDDDENAVDAITGATVSSRSVCSIVNAALVEFRAQLRKRAEAAPEPGQGGSDDGE